MLQKLLLSKKAKPSVKLHCPEDGFNKYCSEEKIYSKLILLAFGVKSNSKTVGVKSI